MLRWQSAHREGQEDQVVRNGSLWFSSGILGQMGHAGFHFWNGRAVFPQRHNKCKKEYIDKIFALGGCLMFQEVHGTKGQVTLQLEKHMNTHKM
eukprot:6304510-Karenia_brevis.AAC.1